MFPIKQTAEQDLYNRILLLESEAEEQVVNFLRQSTPQSFFTHAAQSAWEARCRIQTIQQNEQSQKHYQEIPHLQSQAKVFRSAYNNDTLWLRLADHCEVYGPDGEPMEGDLEKILRRGRYEFIIRASVVFLDKRASYGNEDYTFASLILRISQIRYKAQAEQAKSVYRFQPAYETPVQPCNDEIKYDPFWSYQSAPESDPPNNAYEPTTNPSPWMSSNLKDWVGIINGDVPLPTSHLRVMSPKTPPNSPITPPICAPVIDLTNSQDANTDPWQASQFPLQEPSIIKKPCLKRVSENRKRR